MNFAEWEPIYEAILDDFGYVRDHDESARDRLADLTVPFDLERFDRVRGSTVLVAGGAASLRDELDAAAAAEVVFAASTAADVLLDAGIAVDAMVTDLDKNTDTAESLTHEGVPVAVHAHGDNRDAIDSVVPLFDTEHVLPTTQAAPFGPVVNVGGFTDGDRAAFLADHLGAARIRFAGWDFDDPTVAAEKAKKLAWAERLLHVLERRRGERFEVLDGRRDAIEPVPLG